MENKASELGIPIDRNKIMRELMHSDMLAREKNHWGPIKADAIRVYHRAVFGINGLPESAWTGTVWDDRAGPGIWCMNCNGVERGGQTTMDAFEKLFENLIHDWQGTSEEFSGFVDDLFRDGVLSETMADLALDQIDSIALAGVVKALFQLPLMSLQG